MDCRPEIQVQIQLLLGQSSRAVTGVGRVAYLSRWVEVLPTRDSGGMELLS